ncbi:MAG TPA: DUF4279 domain-containing protein [Oculatellaceae cyanobacterium]
MTDANSVTIPVNSKPIRVRCTLSVSHESLVPAEVTEFLNLQPTQCHGRNQLKTGRSVPTRSGKWELNSQDLTDDTDVSTHVRWLIHTIFDKREQLLVLQQRGYRILLICRFGIAHWNTTITLPTETIAMLAQMNLPLELDIYDEQE